MWVKAFIDYLRYERNLSERTIMVYQAALKEFEQLWRALDSGLSWSTIDGDVIRHWMLIMMERGNTASSVCARMAALRSFYKFLLRRGMVDHDPVHLVQMPKKEKVLPSFVRESEMDRLLDGEDIFPPSVEGMRDHLILLTFYSTGIRLSELVGLNVKDVDCAAQQVRVTGKRNKQRIVPFGEELRAAMCEYLNWRESQNSGMTGNEPFFVVPTTGMRLTPDKVRRVVKHYLSLVTSQKKKSPHVLRHTFATSMLNHHADLQSVKELLGHERLSTTEIYTHTCFEELKEMYKHAHPRA